MKRFEDMTFTEKMEAFKMVKRAGDVKEIAFRANCSTQTVRNLWRRTDILETTEKEREVYIICKERFCKRIKDLQKME